MTKNVILALLISSAFFACVGDIGTTLKTEQANRLLSGDSAKFWLRTFRTEDGAEIDVTSTCEDGGLVLFARGGDNPDTLFMLTRYSPTLCEESVLPILFSKAVYTLSGDIDDNFENQIEITEAEPNTLGNLEVIDLTSNFLQLKYVQDEKEIVELYDGSAENQPSPTGLTFIVP